MRKFLCLCGVLLAGCLHDPAPAPTQPLPGPPAPGGAGDLALTPEEDRQAEALARYSHALLLSHRGETEAALREFQEAAALDPMEVHLQTRIAHELLRNERQEEAIEVLDRALTHFPDNAPLRVLRGVARERRGDTDGALADYRAAVESDPDDPTGYLHLRNLYLEEDRPEEAADVMEAIVRRRPDDASLWEKLAEVYSRRVATANPEEARILGEKMAEAFENADEADPGNPRILARLASTYLGLGRFDDAAETYRRLLEVRPDAYLVREALAQTYVRAGRPEDAIREYEQLVGQEPLIARFHLRLADLYEQTGNTPAFESNLETFLVLNPTEREDVYLRLALSRARRGDLDAALEAVRDAEERFPDSEEALRARFYLQLAGIREEEGDLDGAEEAYLRAFESEPDVPGHQVYRKLLQQAYMRLALLLARRDRIDEAVERIREGVERMPDTPEMLYVEGLLLGDAGRFEEAARALLRVRETAAEKRPDLLTAEFFFRLGAVLEQAGRYEEAAEAFRESIRLDGSQADAYNYLGYMFAEQDMHLEEAEKMIRKALELEPDNGAFLDSLGWVFYRQEKYREALDAIRRAAERLGDDPVIFDHLGDVLLRLGREDEAIPQWRRALELDPDNEEIRRKLDDHAPPGEEGTAPEPSGSPGT